MAVVVKPLFEVVQLTNGAVAYYTATVPTRIDKMTVHNPTGSAATVTVYWVPSGGAAGATNALVTTRPVQSLESWDVFPFMGQVLATGDNISAVASAGATINFSASGTLISQ